MAINSNLGLEWNQVEREGEYILVPHKWCCKKSGQSLVLYGGQRGGPPLSAVAGKELFSSNL